MTEVPFQTPEMPSQADLADPQDETEPERSYTPAPGLPPEAPYGYTIDRKTGEKRPRKRAGRGVRVVREEVGPQAVDTPVDKAPEREPDRIPGRVKPEDKTRRTRTRSPKPEPEPLPVFRAGPIAKSVNKLYLRAGKLVRAMDQDLGTAIIASTRAETEDDVTVGEAWEEVAKNNPRIRRMLLKLISGGAWSQLFMAHAPILLAILLKERIARRLPLMGLLSSFLSEEDDGAPGVDQAGSFLAGLTPEDVAEAMAVFQSMPGMNLGFAPDFGRMPEPARAPVAEDFGLGDASA